MSGPLTSSRTPHIFRPYYYGPHKWEDYLIDIQETISATGETLHLSLEGIAGGLEELRADFEWGFTLMVDCLERQIKALNEIAQRLDAIREAVEWPSTTRAREFFALGQRDLQSGFLPEALEKFLAAEHENKVSFLLQLQLGKLLLYGKNHDSNVIDLVQAEHHLLLAARYSSGEKSYTKYYGEALFHAAIAAYLIGERERAAGRSDGMRECLERGVTALRKAAASWPEFLEIFYTQAKCHALLGQNEYVLSSLKVLSDRDRRYFLKMARDKDFDSIRSEAEAVFRRAVTEPGPLATVAQSALREAEQALIDAENTRPISSQDVERIGSTRAILSQASESLGGLDVDIDRLVRTLLAAKEDMERLSRCDHVVDCDADPELGFCGGKTSGYETIDEHRRYGKLKFRVYDGDLYANGIRVIRYQSPKQQIVGKIKSSELYNELKNKSVLNACVFDYLLKHPEIRLRWPGCTLFLGTIMRDPDGSRTVRTLRSKEDADCRVGEMPWDSCRASYIDGYIGPNAFVAVLEFNDAASSAIEPKMVRSKPTPKSPVEGMLEWFRKWLTR